MIELHTLIALEWLVLPGVAILLTAVLLGGSIRRSRLTGRIREVELQLADAAARLADAERLITDRATETETLRRQVAELGERQEKIAATRTGNGLRQAIALSRHGATTRQLIDTCGLSQGEAHLVQTLYGRLADDAHHAPAQTTTH